MRETRADTTQAFALALALHVLLFLGLFAGLWWTRSAAPAGAPGAVSADVVDVASLSSSMQRALRSDPRTAEPLPLPEPAPEVEPLPEPEPVPEEVPAPEQAAPQDFIPEPDTESREAVVEQPTPKPAIEKIPQDAKRRQEQVDLTERERQREEQRRKAEELADTERRIAEIRRKRVAASRDAELAEQKLQQLADARSQSGRPAEDAARADAAASAPPGAGGSDDGLRAQYQAAIMSAILTKWTRPESVALGRRCRIYITQIVGGEVVSVSFDPSCPYDEMGRRSVEAAVRKASPLPYAGFETVFNRRLNLNFEAAER